MFNQNALSLQANNDLSSHRAVRAALKVIGFSEDEIESIYRVLATILLLVILL